jgi:hypothetical protein
VSGLVLLGFLIVVVLQFAHGVGAGHELSRAGQEARTLLGFGTFFMVLPLLDDPGRRERLLIGLTAVAVVLGAWGILQWAGNISFGAAGDVGVREGVRLTSAGAGQLQGGLFGFPVALIMCTAVLASGTVRREALRITLIVAIALNAVCVFVTFERTLWIAALVGVAFVTLGAPGVNRVKSIIAIPLIALVAVAGLAMFAPAQLQTAGQRLGSITQYQSDDSVRYRLTESRFVRDEIAKQPLVGSGLSATIFWGQPWAQQPPKEFAFSHSSYLWLAWKLGLPAAAALLLLIGAAIVLPAPRARDAVDAATRRGARGALIGLLLVAVTFPALGSLSITPAIGVLLALAIGGRTEPVPTVRPRPVRVT